MDRLLAIAEAAVSGASAQLGACAFVGSQDVRTKWLAASALASGGGPVPPPGFAFVVQSGAYVLDGTGSQYVIQGI